MRKAERGVPGRLGRLQGQPPADTRTLGIEGPPNHPTATCGELGTTNHAHFFMHLTPQKARNRCRGRTPSGAHRGLCCGPQRTSRFVCTYMAKAKRKVEGAAPICGGLRCGGWAVRARRREETSYPDPPNAIYRQ